jgi:hypothetical protein
MTTEYDLSEATIKITNNKVILMERLEDSRNKNSR